MTRFLSFLFFIKWLRDFPGSSMVKTSPSDVEIVSLIPSWGAKLPICLGGKKTKPWSRNNVTNSVNDYKDSHIKRILKKWLSSVLLQVYTPHLLYSCIHLRALRLILYLSTVNNAINTWMHISLWIYVFILLSGTAGSYIVLLLIFCGMSVLLFIVTAPVDIPASGVGGFSFCHIVDNTCFFLPFW